MANKNKEILEDYVSFETAKLLKKKGFKVETEHELWYVAKEFSTGCHWNSCTYKVGETTREYDSKYCISMPTLQMAMKWLREVHKININIIYDLQKFEKTDGSVEDVEVYEVDIVSGNGTFYIGNYNHYESAAEAAIKYCLENLI